MKRLNEEEVKQFAEALMLKDEDAKEITDLFYVVRWGNPLNCTTVSMPLKDVDDYIREWENHWHRESNWEEYYKYEKDNCKYCYADTDEEADKIFETLESFRECVSSHSYELRSGMIIIVC